jgi:hypothetical protein
LDVDAIVAMRGLGHLGWEYRPGTGAVTDTDTDTEHSAAFS